MRRGADDGASLSGHESVELSNEGRRQTKSLAQRLRSESDLGAARHGIAADHAEQLNH
jgi:broad specificity phosphatase PhoE